MTRIHWWYFRQIGLPTSGLNCKLNTGHWIATMRNIIQFETWDILQNVCLPGESALLMLKDSGDVFASSSNFIYNAVTTFRKFLKFEKPSAICLAFGHLFSLISCENVTRRLCVKVILSSFCLDFVHIFQAFCLVSSTIFSLFACLVASIFFKFFTWFWTDFSSFLFGFVKICCFIKRFGWFWMVSLRLWHRNTPILLGFYTIMHILVDLRRLLERK